MVKRICFRVDANSKIGQGHAMRCRVIAEELKSQGVSCLFAVADPDSQGFFINSGFPCYCLGMKYDDYSIEAATLFLRFLAENEVDAVLIDSYYINNAYVYALESHVRTACFYCGEDRIDADLLVNYNINYDRDFYLSEYADSDCKLLLGTAYVPLRKEFRNHPARKERPQVKNLLFLTGGSDPLGLVRSFTKICTQLDGCTITAVAGAYSGLLDDMDSAGLPNNINIIGPTDRLCSMMLESDLVISAGGCTMYELCALGVPSIIYSMVDNQIPESVYMGEMGYVKYIGDARQAGFWAKLLSELYELRSLEAARQKMSDKMRSVTDGFGAQRIADHLISL